MLSSLLGKPLAEKKGYHGTQRPRYNTGQKAENQFFCYFPLSSLEQNMSRHLERQLNRTKHREEQNPRYLSFHAFISPEAR